MCSVVNHTQIAPPADVVYRTNITWPTPHMHADHPGGARGDHLLNHCGIDVVSCRIKIAKYWRDTLPLQCVRGSNKSVRRDYDLAGKFRGADGNFQRYSTIAHGDAVLDPDESGDILFQFQNAGSSICQPSAIDDIPDPLQQSLLVSDIRAANV